MTINRDGHNMLKGEIKTKKTTYEICRYKLLDIIFYVNIYFVYACQNVSLWICLIVSGQCNAYLDVCCHFGYLLTCIVSKQHTHCNACLITKTLLGYAQISNLFGDPSCKVCQPVSLCHLICHQTC